MKNPHLYLLLAGISLLLSPLSGQDTWSGSRPDGHAPIGVMGDHTHDKGEFMLSYRYMRMHMEGMRKGTNTLENADVVRPDGEGYMVTPVKMPMDMHMIGAMYAPSDKLTLMAMINFLTLSMDHQTRMGGTFTTESGGLGDIRISGLYKFLDRNRRRMHAMLGLSIPTGAIDQQDVTPASAPNETQLPYPMQLGSGTFDLNAGLTFLQQVDKASLGAQASGWVRLGENAQAYTLGHQFQATAWLAYGLSSWLSASARIKGMAVQQIQGSDPAYNMAVNMRMVPTVFAENFGGNTVSLGGGVNLYVPGGPLKNLRMGLEAEVPFYQDLNGTQMETDYVLTLGLQYAF